MVTLPEKSFLDRKIVYPVHNTHWWRLKHRLIDEVKKLAGQSFCDHDAVALVLLSVTKKVLQEYYGEDKSMGSLEGMGFVGNVLSKYILVIFPEEETSRGIIRGIEKQLFLML